MLCRWESQSLTSWLRDSGGRPALSACGSSQPDMGSGASTRASTGASTRAGTGANTRANTRANTGANIGARTKIKTGSNTRADVRASIGANTGARTRANTRARTGARPVAGARESTSNRWVTVGAAGSWCRNMTGDTCLAVGGLRTLLYFRAVIVIFPRLANGSFSSVLAKRFFKLPVILFYFTIIFLNIVLK